MKSKVKITDQKELGEFVRTHLGHRLTAMVSPICLPWDHPFWRCPNHRNDGYRAAKEGSYSMLRLFVEFLGVKSCKGKSCRLIAADGEEDSILLDAFSRWGVQKVKPEDFGSDKAFIAGIHRTLCKINAHFTYDARQPEFYDRIASPNDERQWKRAVEIVVGMLDEYFYQRVRQPITVHFDLVSDFKAQFGQKLRLKSPVKGDGLGRRPAFGVRS